jgi:hypothetical protein
MLEERQFPGTLTAEGLPAKVAASIAKASVAQLDRASVFGTDGWGFESLRARSGSKVGGSYGAPLSNIQRRIAYNASLAAQTRGNTTPYPLQGNRALSPAIICRIGATVGLS